MARPLAELPKAHLHLHFTGAMRHSTVVGLARSRGVRLPEALVADWPPHLRGTDERGWFRFQRLYDVARSVIRTEADVRRLIREAAEDERDEGSGWLEIQVDPSGYAGRLGGLTPVVELVLDAAAAATPADVPLRRLLDAGIPVALGADDPLLFGQRLTAQYRLARQAHGLSDDELAELARMSVRGSVAPAEVRSRLLAGIDAWLASPEAAHPDTGHPGAPGGQEVGPQ